jgi:2-amino-4-hydroxy-6-hydroxymethyldihydropteridine diphosphokinase
MNEVYILLGSNLGDRAEYLSQARERLSLLGDIQLLSSVYETDSWGKSDQPSYLNQVILLQTNLGPVDLLAKTQKIEADLDRVRDEKWGSRTLDIDILYFNDNIIFLPDLQIPHQQLPFRRFTLVPLKEIAPDFIHPLFKVSSSELLDLCDDKLQVHRFED